MPRILILGGTGAIGVLLVREALAAGHTAVVYARTPSKLPADLSSHAHVVVLKGTFEDTQALADAVKGVKAVVSALGPSIMGHPPGTPVAKAYGAVIKAMKKHGVKRLIALSTPSVPDDGDVYSYRWAASVLAISTFVPNTYADIIASAETIKNDGAELDWTLVRVAFLGNGLEREVVAGYTGDGKTGFTLPRIGFAAFVVGELEKNEWTRKAPLISGA